MTTTRHIIAAVAIALAFTSGCKNDAGDSQTDQNQPEPTKAAPAETESAENADLESGAKNEEAQKDEQKQDDKSKLGEGTDVQRRLMAEAKQAFLTNDLEQAEKIFSALFKTEPVSGPQVSGAIALAQIYNETDRPEKAIELYEQLSERVDDLPEVQLVIARSFARQGESTRAIDTYKNLLEAQPDFVFALLELGEIYSQAGREDEATKVLYKYEKKIYSLAQTLENPETNPGERLRILDIFSFVSDDRATEAVVKALGSKEPQVRKKAATVLGETGAGEATKVLEHASINDPHLGVRMAAKDALQRLEKLGADSGEQIGPSFVKEKDELPDE